ncbi:hypothetical protein HAP48_0035165 [Bradyrhizobium septentrionale]|uniref:Uncharacterized protein n=1 Tax=Bradyrhizobium septentrionale TaxID=1404411 RepID=A0A974A1T8_9BRAD|nr:hypothetical protein [Bradyrhizobium septentrionale]UGY13775.1 hypothetical protein HAP48_0035165 [Bradyrhizobium septentrionale]
MPVRGTDLSTFEFEEVVTSVEERFMRVYNAAKVGNAKVESQMEHERVSTGWWLVIQHLGLALWIGTDKPAIETGDVVRIRISKP